MTPILKLAMNVAAVIFLTAVAFALLCVIVYFIGALVSAIRELIRK